MRAFTSVLPACAVLVAAALAGCATPQQVVSQKENNLSAAGFLVRPADTPAREAMLHKLPAEHFVRRDHGDNVDYVYADPLVCNCLYVGSQAAYDQYKLHMQQKRLADEQLMAAEDYADPAWNWGAWGPWGPGFGGFGPGYGW
jgi:hypothetical protein